MIIFYRIQNRISKGTFEVFLVHVHHQKVLFTSVVLISLLLFSAMRWIFNKLKNDMFIVFSTLQYPVRKMLEKQYDTILSSKDPALAPPKPQSVFMLFFSLNLALGFVLIPIILGIRRLVIANSLITPQKLPESPLNITIPFMAYYEHNLLESRLCNNMMDKCPHEHDVRCVHHFFQRAEPQDMVPIVGEISDDSWSRILMLLMSHAAAFAFFVFMTKLKKLMRTFWESSHLLFAIPVHIGRSNYIFTKLITGDKIDSSDVTEYVRELWNDTASYDLFGVLRFNQSGEITENVGCAVKILGKLPKNVDELREALISCGVSPSALEHFFENRTPTSVIYGRGTSPFMAYFSTPTEFFMKDESSDVISSRTDIINSLCENSKIERPPLVENALLLFFKGVTKADYDGILAEYKKSLDFLILAEGRFSSLVFTCSVSSPSIASKVFEFAKKCNSQYHSGRYALTYGGQINILQPNRQMIEKSRGLGRPFRDAEYIVNCMELEDHKLYVQKELLDLFEFDTSALIMKEVTIREDKVNVAVF